MAAPKGNQFWKNRSSHGPKPKFANRDVLWAACVEYFDWVAENPLEEDKIFRVEGKLEHAKLERMRAMTLHGLCIFLGLSHASWHRYRKRRGFAETMNRVEAIIRTQKFEGAAAFMLHANIISTDIRLGERPEADSDESTKAKVKVDAEEVTRKLLHGVSGGEKEGSS